MGYAKYQEDILRTYAQNIFGTRLDFQVRETLQTFRCPFCTFETHKKLTLEEHLLAEHGDAAVFLEYDDRPVPERAVLGIRPIHLRVRCPNLPNGIDIEVASRVRPRSPRRYNDGELLRITPPDEEAVEVILKVSAYKRRYFITFKKHVYTARLTPYFIDAITTANSAIEGWKWSDVAKFEEVILGERRLSQEEDNHRRGVQQFYLALWLEQNHKPEYARHYEEAYERLRYFDDPVAQLISSYFLYRVNAFAAILPVSSFPELRRVVRFFCGPREHEEDTLVTAKDEIVPVEIAIADGDKNIFAAVNACLEGSLLDALNCCENAMGKIPVGDDQSLCKINLLCYRIHQKIGNVKKARAYATRLAGCSVESFRREAEEFLRNQ